MDELLPYFLTTCVALFAIFGVLVWSGAVSFRKWRVAPGILLRGVFDNLDGVSTREQCYGACSQAIYSGCSFTEKASKGSNCQLFRTVACAALSPDSVSKYDSALGSVEELTAPCSAAPARKADPA